MTCFVIRKYDIKWHRTTDWYRTSRFYFRKRNYEYDVTLGTYPEFSQREISTSELDELSTNELIYITEEILTKHGLIFFNNETRDMFNHKEWYIPLNYRVNNLLTKIEKIT